MGVLTRVRVDIRAGGADARQVSSQTRTTARMKDGGDAVVPVTEVITATTVLMNNTLQTRAAPMNVKTTKPTTTAQVRVSRGSSDKNATASSTRKESTFLTFSSHLCPTSNSPTCRRVTCPT